MISQSSSAMPVHPDTRCLTHHATVAERLFRMVDVATAQTRLMGKRLENSRARRRASMLVGIIAGFAGLVGSVLITLETGAVSDLWWLVIPTWILAATPIIVLRQEGVDKLAVLHARSAGATALAHEVFSAINVDVHHTAGTDSGADGLEALALFLEQDIEAVGRTLSVGVATGAARRRHKRITPRNRKVFVKTRDGRRLMANIADVSLSGVAMTECLPRLSAGDSVLIGRTRATVSRCWRNGIAFEFEDDLDPSTFSEDIVL